MSDKKLRHLHQPPPAPAAPMPDWRPIPSVKPSEKAKHPYAEAVSERLEPAPVDERPGEVDDHGQVHREGPPMVPDGWRR